MWNATGDELMCRLLSPHRYHSDVLRTHPLATSTNTRLVRADPLPSALAMVYRHRWNSIPLLSTRKSCPLCLSRLIQSPHTTLFFFLNNPPPPEIYPLPLHAALPISARDPGRRGGGVPPRAPARSECSVFRGREPLRDRGRPAASAGTAARRGGPRRQPGIFFDD